MALLDKELIQKIGRPHNVCLDCGASIQAQGRHPSAVVTPGTEPEGADSTLRRDYCADCWEQHRNESYLGHWIARRDPPKPKPIRTRKQRNSALLQYFREIEAGQHHFSDAEAAKYFLAHLLMRYSVFKWQHNSEADDGEKIYFKAPDTDVLVGVESRDLSDDELTEFNAAIEGYLQDYRAPEAADATAAENLDDTTVDVVGPPGEAENPIDGAE